MDIIENVLGKKPLAEKQLERDRYIEAQINFLQSKLQRLERIFSVGMPLSDAEETIDRLDQIEKGIKITDSKINMFSSVLKELKADHEKFIASMDEKAGLQQLSMISQRVKFLENIYGELSSGKTKDIFMNIVEIMRNLENRIKSLEDIAHKNISLMVQQEISKVKAEVGKGAGALEARRAAGGAAPPGPQGVEAIVWDQPEAGGVGAKIMSFFRKIFGRK